MSAERLRKIKEDITAIVAKSKKGGQYATTATLEEYLPFEKTKCWQLIMTIPGAFQIKSEWVVSVDILAQWIYDKESSSVSSKK